MSRYIELPGKLEDKSNALWEMGAEPWSSTYEFSAVPDGQLVVVIHDRCVMQPVEVIEYERDYNDAVALGHTAHSQRWYLLSKDAVFAALGGP